jgi:nucleotide-binding universal stress UspA family protein
MTMPLGGVRPPIVVATDFSEAASVAVEDAAILTRCQHADLHVLHVFNDGVWATLKNLYDTKHWSGDDPVLTTRRRLSELTEDVARRHGIHAVAEAETGDPASTIARFAEQCGARLIVIGKESEDWLTDTILGETALELLEETEVPVMIARRRNADLVRRVLVATDFSTCSRRAALLACQLFPDAEVTLFNAYSVRYESRMRIGGASEDDIASYRLTEQVNAESAMRQLVFAIDRKKRLKTVVEYGHAAPAIVAQASVGFDVIVVGKNGDDPVKNRLGGVTKNVLYHADCNVLLVP